MSKENRQNHSCQGHRTTLQFVVFFDTLTVISLAVTSLFVTVFEQLKTDLEVIVALVQVAWNGSKCT